jgi:heterodisulfide reductase subunit C/nitrate reductase gamma subunit
MIKQVIFTLTLLLTVLIFAYTVRRLIRFFKLTKPAFPISDFRKRIWITLEVALGQSKIFRRPVIGFLHALVFWGFCVILIGSIEMIIDGLFNYEKSLQFLGPFYDIIIASGDIFSLLVAISIVIFLIRRIFLHIKRFEGIEMKRISHIDANIALTLILLLMISLTLMNAAYCGIQIISGTSIIGFYPVGNTIAMAFQGFSHETLTLVYEISWWSHILLIFLFINILPYSKHFHVFMSVPNVFLSRLDPLGKLPSMDHVTREVKLMLDPDSRSSAPQEETMVRRFGVKDCEDVSWKNYFDSLACTQCGRCTSVCPANLTGKKLTPRKIMMDVRARMNEKGPGLVRNGYGFDDHKSLIRDYISEEELWACTTCQACAQECPININHPTLIVDMRRYLVMEEGSAPGGVKTSFSNIENNGAPWQFSPEDRLLWTKDLKYHSV